MEGRGKSNTALIAMAIAMKRNKRCKARQRQWNKANVEAKARQWRYEWQVIGNIKGKGKGMASRRQWQWQRGCQRQGKARQGKARQGKARQGKARRGNGDGNGKRPCRDIRVINARRHMRLFQLSADQGCCKRESSIGT